MAAPRQRRERRIVIAIVVFWLALAIVVYAYAGYPLLVAARARLWGTEAVGAPVTPPVTVVVAAYNEDARIADRVRDVLAQDYPADCLRVVVASDGSTDGTVAAASAVGDPRVDVLALADNRGKAAALAAALARVTTPIVAFTDARQRFAPYALRRLVEPLADPAVGAVSGELEIRTGTDAGARPADIGLYWRMEKALREGEARLGWLHGVSGAIHAMRRELIVVPPDGTILDDMFLPLAAVFAGKRVWMVRNAIAIDVASGDEGEEFRRKLRTLAGNWQLMARLPRLLSWRDNPVWFAFVSHKLARLIVPWALIAALIASAYAPGAFYRALFGLQLAGYVAAAIALAAPRQVARIPLLPTAGTFVLLNAAALLSLPACLMLDPRGLWKKH